MKAIDTPYKSNAIKWIITLIVITFLFNSKGFSQPAKKKISPRISLEYFNKEDNSRSLKATLYVIENRVRVPVVNEKIFFYVGDISDENILDSITTDVNGVSEYVFPEDYNFPVDEERIVTYFAQFNGNKSYRKKSK